MPGGKHELGSQPPCSMVWTRMDYHQLFHGHDGELLLVGGAWKRSFLQHDVSPLFSDKILFLQEVLHLACLGLHGHEGGQLQVGDLHLWPPECINNLQAQSSRVVSLPV